MSGISLAFKFCGGCLNHLPGLMDMMFRRMGLADTKPEDKLII